MPLRRGFGGVSSGAGGNLFDRPGFFDYSKIVNLTVDTKLLLKAASETYGVTITHSTQTANYNLDIPVLAANDTFMVIGLAQTLSNKTLASPKITTGIYDTNGNELLLVTATGSAVNELTLANAATSNPPVLSATGGDTNIGITLTPKGSGVVRITGGLTVDGTTTTIDSTTLTVDDKNIELGSVDTPTDTTADGGGITLKGATDKTIIWDNSNDNWTSNQDWNIASGKAFKINNVSTLNATTLGSAVVTSSLTTVGTLGSVDIDGGDIASGVTINKSPTITLTGDVTASATAMTNLGNVSLATTIAANSVDSDQYVDGSINFVHIQDVAANSILGRNANSSGVLSEVALATTQILIGDGTGFTVAALSGDVTMTNAGVVSIGATKVTGAMLNTDVISGTTAELTTGLATTDELLVSDNGTLSRMDVSVLYAATATLTNKSIDLGTNTLTGSVAEFNTALQSESFATLAGSETLTNKTLTTPTIGATGWTNATHAHAASNSGGTIATITGNAATATALATGRTIGMTGDVVWTSASFTGSGNVTAVATIQANAVDSAEITAGAIDYAHIQNVAANSILGRNANSSGVLSEVALATTQILIGDGTGFTAAALSGDVTMTNAGVVTIADNAIDSEHYADGSIDNAHIADNAIDSEHYADGSIDNAHIADDAIDSEHYVNGSVDNVHLANSAVTITAGTGLTGGGSTALGATSTLNVIGGDGITANANDMAITPAQTTITSIYATDLIMGEDSQTAIDFGTANEIDFKINNTTELTLDASALYPTTDAGLDLGTSILEFKDAFFDGTVTADGFTVGSASLLRTVLGGLYDDILGIIGSTGIILPVGDSLHSPTSTTFKTLGEEQVTFTYSEDPAGFDVPQGEQGIVPILTFNGSDEQADTPDRGYFSLGDGTAGGDVAFTIGAMIRLTSGGSGTRNILAKYASGAAEWLMAINPDGKVQLTCGDQSAGVDSVVLSDAAISEDVWHLVIATRPAAGTGATAMDSVIISVDDATVASTATSSSSYVGMENTSAVVELGHYLTAGGRWFAGSMALPFLVKKVVTPDEKLRIWDIVRRAMGL